MSYSKKINFLKSIKFRSWVGICILSILPLICFGLYAFDALGDVSRDILIEGNIQAFQQVKYEVNQYISNFDDLISYAAKDECFTEEGAEEEALERLRQLDQSYESIERIIWVDNSGNFKGHSKLIQDLSGHMSYAEKALASSNRSFTFAPESFLIKAKVGDKPDSGAIIATISFLKLRKSFEGLTFGTNFRYYLVTSSGENILEQPNFPAEVIADLMERPCGAYDLYPEFDGGSPQLAISLPILRYDLRIFVFQNAGEVYAIARKLGNNTLNFIWLLGLASFVLAIYLSWSITAPITAVANKAEALSNGEENVVVNIDRDDEIGFLAKSFNDMSTKISRKITEVSSLYKVTRFISGSTNSRIALDLCLDYLVSVFKAQRGSIMLLNEEHTALVVESFKLAKIESDSEDDEESKDEDPKEKPASDVEEPKTRFELRLGEGIAGEVAVSGKAILCTDCATDERFKSYAEENSRDASKTPKTLVSVPLQTNGKVIGVINLSDRSDSQPFTGSDLDLLQAIANQMALSIENAKLHDLSVINEQTSLFVRRFLEIRLDDEIKRSKRFGFPLTVVMLSVDKFAELNSSYGKRACGATLYSLGRLLKKTVRATDIPAEFDTNKLCVILAHTTDEQAKMFADRFRGIVANHEITSGTYAFKVTMSAGVCQYSESVENYEDLLMKTDEALNNSRKKGNATAIYSTEGGQNNA